MTTSAARSAYDDTRTPVSTLPPNPSRIEIIARAMPKRDYHFVGWTTTDATTGIEITLTENPLTVTLTANVAYEEAYLKKMMIEAAGLALERTYYGYWPGREKADCKDFQDILLLRK